MKKLNVKVNKKYLKVSVVLVAIILAGFGLKSLSSNNIATVDIKAVVIASPEVEQIRQANAEKLAELDKWLDQAKQDIQAEKKKAKQADLIKEYKEEAKKRELDIKYEYSSKIVQVEEKINALINKVAKAHSCNIVLDNKSVVQGGIDITKEVIEKLKK